MTKNKKANGRSKSAKTLSKGVRVRGTASQIRKTGGLDAPGAAWARLIADPCNAPLVSPCYPSNGTGQFVRLRRIIPLPAAPENNSIQLAFAPGQNALWKGETRPEAPDGTTSAAEGAFSGLADNYDSFRCVAACLKVTYVGTESGRAGTIGLSNSPNPLFNPSETTVSNGFMSQMTQINRVGEVKHEVKWIPSIKDQEFQTTNGSVPNLGSTLTCIVADLKRYLTSGSPGYVTEGVQFELVGIYEVVPKRNSGMMVASVPNQSRNTVADVMRALGPTAHWLYGHMVAPVLRSMAVAGTETLRTGVQALVAQAPLMVGL